MKYCCQGFRNALENKRDDGFVPYVVPPSSRGKFPSFRMAFRAVRSESVPAMRKAMATISSPPTNVKLCGIFGLRFCPWCGAKLVEFYRSSFESLIDEHLLREFEFI